MSTPDRHPDDETLRLFAVGRLTEARGDEIEAHLALCEACARRLEEFEQESSDPLLRKIRAASLAVEPDRNTPEPFVSGTLLGGHFRLEERLGRGGMGEAWKAFDETAHRHVVLKFVPKDVLHVAEAMNAVLDSFQKVHALQHSHICPLYLLDNDPEHGFFLVMKFIDGLPLDAEYRLNGPLPFDETIKILRDVADALDYAHDKRVIHRDVKPANIMVGLTDGVQVIDFGIADDIRATLSVNDEAFEAKISGTRVYMAPEQWLGQKQDARTDQYALAVTAYELLAGHVPFSGSDTEILKNAVLHDPPSPIPDLPEYANTALLRGLAKNREDRFESCRAFVEALSTEYRLIEPPPLPSERAKSLSWNPIRPAIIVPIIVFLCFLTFLPSRLLWQPKPEINAIAPQPIAEKAVNIPVVEERPLPDVPMDGNLFTAFEPPWTDGTKSQTIPLAVPRRSTSGAVPVVRVTVEIDAYAKGRLIVKRCVSTDPLPEFRGTPFESCSFRHAELFRGENGTGRIVFSTGDTETKTPLQAFGWKCWRYGKSSKLPLSMRFVSTHAGERSGIGIGKSGGLPCRITFDVIDKKNVDVPTLDLVLYRNFEQDARCGSVSVWARREGEVLRIGADYYHPWADGGNPGGGRAVIADDVSVEKGGTFTKIFQLPSRITGEVALVKYDLYADRSMTGARPMTFDLSLLDIAGRFNGSAGFTVGERGDKSVVLEIDPTGPATELHHGEEILSINGQGGPATRLRKVLEALKFGDLVEVKTAAGANAGTTTVFSAE